MNEGELPTRYRGCRDLELEWRSRGILVIALNRAEKRNAIGVEMTLDIERTLLTARDDAELHGVVFHGKGGNFSSGMDMRDFFDHSARDPKVIRRARAATDHWRTRLLRRLPQHVVSAVQGYCLGGAIPILECSDVVLASTDAVIGLPEINFGFVPGGPIAKSMRQTASVRGASYASLTGRPFDARQAQRWGLVTEVVDGGDIRAEAIRLVETMVERQLTRSQELTR